MKGVLNRLKTYTRSTMTGERLNGLAMLHIRQSIMIDPEEVIDLFALMNHRLHFTDKIPQKD